MYFEWFERSPMLAWTQSPVTASEHQVTANLGSQANLNLQFSPSTFCQKIEICMKNEEGRLICEAGISL